MTSYYVHIMNQKHSPLHESDTQESLYSEHPVMFTDKIIYMSDISVLFYNKV